MNEVATPSGQFNNIAAVFNSESSVAPYVNGQPGNQGATTSALVQGHVPDSSVSIGARLDESFFTGTVGEVLIYNRALTPMEIHQNYLATRWRYQ